MAPKERAEKLAKKGHPFAINQEIVVQAYLSLLEKLENPTEEMIEAGDDFVEQLLGSGQDIDATDIFKAIAKVAMEEI